MVGPVQQRLSTLAVRVRFLLVVVRVVEQATVLRLVALGLSVSLLVMGEWVALTRAEMALLAAVDE
jgi:hypothetical protein